MQPNDVRIVQQEGKGSFYVYPFKAVCRTTCTESAQVHFDCCARYTTFSTVRGRG